MLTFECLHALSLEGGDEENVKSSWLFVAKYKTLTFKYKLMHLGSFPILPHFQNATNNRIEIRPIRFYFEKLNHVICNLQASLDPFVFKVMLQFKKMEFSASQNIHGLWGIVLITF